MKNIASPRHNRLVWQHHIVPMFAVLLLAATGCGRQPSESPSQPSAESQLKTSRHIVKPIGAGKTQTPVSSPGKPVAKQATAVQDSGTPDQAAPGDAILEEPLDVNGQIQAIKEMYAEINSNIRTYETDTNSFHEGGEVPVTLYWEGRNLRKVTIDALGSFDMLSYYVEGYFKADRLIFVMYRESNAVNPNMATGEVEAWHHTQHRVYVNNGVVIRYLKKAERQTPEAKSQIQKVANVPVRDPMEISEMSRNINDWFGAASMVSLFGNRGYPCCLTLIEKSE